MTTCTIEKFSHDARGIARISDKITFVEGAIPNELVEIEYVRKKKDYDEARTVSVLESSDLRVSPKCPVFKTCGGCSLQHIDSNAQINIKQSQLLDLIARIGHTTPQDILPPLSADLWHYRHKSRLSVRFVEKKGKVLVGFREKNQPRYITDTHTCDILPSSFAPVLKGLPDFIASLACCRDVPQIELAVGENRTALIFRIMCALSPADEDALQAFAKQHDVDIWTQLAGPDSIKPLKDTKTASYLTYSLPDYDLTLQFHPTDFTQVNPALNRKMVKQAMELLNPQSDEVILDLFCGLGNFSLPLAKLAKQVIGIEGSETMVERARMNAEHYQLLNTEFYAANLEDAAVYTRYQSLNITKVLCDPPRAGALSFVKNIEQINPDVLLYISCDPATLARDTNILVHEKGYCLKKAGVMDMFPHTTHVESMALFERER